MEFKNIAIDRETLLALAARHVSEGMARVQRQRELLERLKRDGHSTELAESFLVTLEFVVRGMIEHREELRAAMVQQQFEDTEKPSNYASREFVKPPRARDWMPVREKEL